MTLMQQSLLASDEGKPLFVEILVDFDSFLEIQKRVLLFINEALEISKSNILSSLKAILIKPHKSDPFGDYALLNSMHNRDDNFVFLLGIMNEKITLKTPRIQDVDCSFMIQIPRKILLDEPKEMYQIRCDLTRDICEEFSDIFHKQYGWIEGGFSDEK